MQESWSTYAHVGIVHPMAFPETVRGEGPILETVSEIANDAFFGAIEVSRVKDEATRTKLSKMLEAAHLDVIYSGLPPILVQGIDLNSLNSAIRNKAIRSVRGLVDEAYSINARSLIVSSGPDPIKDREKARTCLVKSLKSLCKYAEQKARDHVLLIRLETFDRDVDKKLLIGPTAEAVKIAKAVREEYRSFGLCIDQGHLPLLKERPEEALSTAKDYVEHVHLGNCIMRDKSHPLYGDQHPRFGICGGENNTRELSAFLRALKDIGYFDKKTATTLPVVSFEVKPAADETSGIIIANSKRVFLDAWPTIQMES